MIERKDEAHMGNCFKVYHHGRMCAVVHSEAMAIAFIVNMSAGTGNTDPYFYGLAFIEGVGF